MSSRTAHRAVHFCAATSALHLGNDPWSLTHKRADSSVASPRGGHAEGSPCSSSRQREKGSRPLARRLVVTAQGRRVTHYVTRWKRPFVPGRVNRDISPLWPLYYSTTATSPWVSKRRRSSASERSWVPGFVPIWFTRRLRSTLNSTTNRTRVRVSSSTIAGVFTVTPGQKVHTQFDLPEMLHVYRNHRNYEIVDFNKASFSAFFFSRRVRSPRFLPQAQQLRVLLIAWGSSWATDLPKATNQPRPISDGLSVHRGSYVARPVSIVACDTGEGHLAREDSLH